MKISSALTGFVGLGAILALGLPLSPAAELPPTIQSARCRTPPTIDGVIGDDEWNDAQAIEFEMSVLLMGTAEFSKRACQLRVMNSANGLYVAFVISDDTVNKSLTPLDIDFALLAFCRGTELAAGDDRKVVGPGVYVDKHVTTPGKDADDTKQDGKGAMRHAKGVATIEWALPLDSGDDEDYRGKPGDTVRFNLAYFDAFHADLKGTKIGAAYPGSLDHAEKWGTLHLAADVKDDGGAAFAGPAWVAELFKGFRALPANRLKLTESVLLPAGSQSQGDDAQVAVKTLVEYSYRDPNGKQSIGKAKLYMPPGAQWEDARFPLYYSAGYELDDATALVHLARGFAVVTPRALEANPLVRTVNPDAALLHIARSLPFVDDTRVVIAGGSAGGWATLLLAAETFPLAGAAPDVPPVNWGYNAAYFLQLEPKSGQPAPHTNDPKATEPQTPKPLTPVFDVIVPIIKQATAVYGPDPNSAAYDSNSPLAHLSTITCPVSVYWSTADMLVPIDQIGPQWVRPFDRKAFPHGFTMDREALTTSADGRRRLFDLLEDNDYELFVFTDEAIQKQAAESQQTKQPVELGDSAQRQWSITILDEGAPEPQLGHVKRQVAWSHQKFISRVTTGEIPTGQLTAIKLERLMNRYAGKEWLPSAVSHLDEPDSERADVVRGLTTYVGASQENASTFSELYATLPAAQQVLPADVLRGLDK